MAPMNLLISDGAITQGFHRPRLSGWDGNGHFIRTIWQRSWRIGAPFRLPENRAGRKPACGGSIEGIGGISLELKGIVSRMRTSFDGMEQRRESQKLRH